MANIFRANNLIASKLLTAQVSGILNVSTDGLLVSNPSLSTGSTAALQQWSPRLNFLGSGWKTNATAGPISVSFIQELEIVSGAAAPVGTFKFQYSVAGAGYTNCLSLATDQSVTVPGTFNVTGVTTITGLLKTGSTPTTLTDAAGKILSAALNAVAVANGGTGQTTYTNGQLLIGNTTGNTLTKATLTQGTGIVVTNSTGSITIGLQSGTAGGVIYYPTTTTIASSAFLTASGVMLGGGTSGPTALSSLGTVNKVLHGNAAGNPTWSAVDLSADVTGTLTAVQGGTGSTFVTFAGASSGHTYTLPDQACTLLFDGNNGATPSFARLGVGTTNVSSSCSVRFAQSVNVSSGSCSSFIVESTTSSGSGTSDILNTMWIHAGWNIFAGSGQTWAGLRVSIFTPTNGTPAVAGGIIIEDITGGTSNYAIKTGLGKVTFGDQLNIGTDFGSTNAGINFNRTITTSGSSAYGFIQNVSMTASANGDVMYQSILGGGSTTIAKGTFTGMSLYGMYYSYPIVTGTGTLSVHYGLWVDVSAGLAASNYAAVFKGGITVFETNTSVGAKVEVTFDSSVQQGIAIQTSNSSSSGNLMYFLSSTGAGIGSISFIGGQTGVGYNVSSDIRLKTNIRTLKSTGEIIDSIKPRIFDWKTGQKDSVGFVAQELYKSVPYAVTKGDDDPSSIKTQWQVDHSKLVPLLTAEIQALRARVAQLEAR